MGEDLKVTIPLERFEELLDIETRATVMQATTINASYCIDRGDIARILGFELPKEQKEEGSF